MAEIDRRRGREAFGDDPASYERGRLGYPAEVYETLRERCGLRAGTRTFEIGPGTGKATRELLRLGAAPLVAIEPDRRLADFLTRTLADHAAALEVRVSTFEDVVLPPASFDLGVAVTMFHWFDQATALRKVATLLRPGGWWAMWWNVYGDPARPDEFHKATRRLLARLDRSPSHGISGRAPFALDAEARLKDFAAAKTFDMVDHAVVRWTATFDADQIKALYATFSPVSLLPAAERADLLDRLGRIAEEQFSDRVERSMVTPLYIARRNDVGLGSD